MGTDLGMAVPFSA